MKPLVKSGKIWAAFVIVFLAGVAIGVVAGAFFFAASKKGMRTIPRKGMMKTRIIRRMNRELSLTSEQNLEVEKIITAMTADVEALHEKQRPLIKNIIDTAFSDIDRILTADQKRKMKKIRERLNRTGKMRQRRCAKDGRGRDSSPVPGRGLGGGRGRHGGMRLNQSSNEADPARK